MIIILVSKIDISNLSEEELLQKQQVSHLKKRDENIHKCKAQETNINKYRETTRLIFKVDKKSKKTFLYTL